LPVIGHGQDGRATVPCRNMLIEEANPIVRLEMANTLFPLDLPEREWTEFAADGFPGPVLL